MKQYEAIELEVISFEDTDIITTSNVETPVIPFNN